MPEPVSELLTGAGSDGQGGFGFRRLDEQIVYRGRLITVVRATFSDPDGGTFEREVVHHPGAVVVVPVVEGGRAALLVRQYRAAVGRELLELPAGKRDVDGEPVEVTARRELAEEVGMRAGRLDQLAEFYNSAGYCDELSHLFLARDLVACPPSPQGIEEAHMVVEPVAFDQVASLVASRAIVDAKTILGLGLARDALGGPG